jgi:hypothetical protein
MVALTRCHVKIMTQKYLEMLANIKFCLHLGKSATETFSMFARGLGERHCLLYISVKVAQKVFSEGHISLNDEHEPAAKSP